MQTMKDIIQVPLGERSYEIQIADGAVGGLSDQVKALPGGVETVCFVTDEHVWTAHGEKAFQSLERAGLRARAIVLSPGESSKNIAGLTRLYDFFAQSGLSRKGLVIAFGGGVIGDLAGFAAATWMRGVRLIQIPTTLLAQVDSSIGGKTAVDIAAGKNLVGAFHQPALVIIDPLMLDTLPAREYAAGMAEVIKYGAIASETLFAHLQSAAPRKALQLIISACCGIKRDIVSEDEYDTGRRMVLNFGHSFGHAIEAKYGFDKYNHGEAVALGMVIAARVGERLGVTTPGVCTQIHGLLERFGLPRSIETEGLLEFMKRDKKSKSTQIDLVLIQKIGHAVIQPVGFGELPELLSQRFSGGMDEMEPPI
jgi:3-dehydroquinate synthase